MERVLREGAFEGETHIVTGAGQGIGNAVAQALALHGAQVTLFDLDAGRLETARDEIAALGCPKPLLVAGYRTGADGVARRCVTALDAGPGAARWPASAFGAAAGSGCFVKTQLWITEELACV